MGGHRRGVEGEGGAQAGHPPRRDAAGTDLQAAVGGEVAAQSLHTAVQESAGRDITAPAGRPRSALGPDPPQSCCSSVPATPITSVQHRAAGPGQATVVRKVTPKANILYGTAGENS